MALVESWWGLLTALVLAVAAAALAFGAPWWKLYAKFGFGSSAKESIPTLTCNLTALVPQVTASQPLAMRAALRVLEAGFFGTPCELNDPWRSRWEALLPTQRPELAVFFHIGALNNYSCEVAQWMLQAMSASGLLEQASLFVGIVGNSSSLLRLPPTAKVVARSTDPAAFEFPTLRAAAAYARGHPQALLLYLHTKG
eukprot:RCo049123